MALKMLTGVLLPLIVLGVMIWVGYAYWKFFRGLPRPFDIFPLFGVVIVELTCLSSMLTMIIFTKW
jgi:hypothetical protein